MSYNANESVNSLFKDLNGNGDTKDILERSLSTTTSNGSGKSTPKQKISWGQVNDIPVSESILNERKENHVSRNEMSLNNVNGFAQTVSKEAEENAASFTSFIYACLILSQKNSFMFGKCGQSPGRWSELITRPKAKMRLIYLEGKLKT